MIANFEITSDQRGVVLHLTGETACLATPTEIDVAVERIREKLSAAAATAKKRLRAADQRPLAPNNQQPISIS